MYRLKDERLAAHYSAIYKGFDKFLDEECKEQMNDENTFILLQVQRSENDIPDHIHIRKQQIKKTYDSKTWNDWPETEPPFLNLMRVEYRDKYGSLRKTCAQFNDLCSPPGWIDFNGNEIEATELKFRPWED